MLVCIFVLNPKKGNRSGAFYAGSSPTARSSMAMMSLRLPHLRLISSRLSRDFIPTAASTASRKNLYGMQQGPHHMVCHLLRIECVPSCWLSMRTWLAKCAAYTQRAHKGPMCSHTSAQHSFSIHHHDEMWSHVWQARPDRRCNHATLKSREEKTGGRATPTWHTPSVAVVAHAGAGRALGDVLDGLGHGALGEALFDKRLRLLAG